MHRSRRSRCLSFLAGALMVGVGVSSFGVGTASAAGQGAVGGLSVAAPAVAPPAAPAVGVHRLPGDKLNVSLPGVSPDFGYVKQGSSVTRVITVLNDGIDSVAIDPAPLAALAAPFHLDSTTIVKGDAIAPMGRRTITVTYTAPAAGTVSSQPVTLVAEDLDAAGSMNLVIGFAGHALATDRAFFVVNTPSGMPVVDFGLLKAGQTATRQLGLEVQGVDPLSFSEAKVVITDGAGKPIPSVTVTASSFGAGTVYKPGETATVDLTFVPTASGSFAGTITITGEVMNGNPETPSIVVATALTAAAERAVDPTPSPTPSPTAPGPTPSPTSTGGPGGAGGGASGGSGTGSTTAGTGGVRLSGGSAGGSLAHTGSEAGSLLGLGVIATLLGGVASALTVRIRRARRG